MIEYLLIRTHNLEVLGSSPSWSTKKISHLRMEREWLISFSPLDLSPFYLKLANNILFLKISCEIFG
jgi:hypothetical protein